MIVSPQEKDKTANPLFSIVTVTYNAQDTVVPTMRSVAEQTCHLYEHIIVDGLSKDETLSLVDGEKTPRTIVHSEKDNGIYDAMNKGIGLARGDYLIFLNAGDKFHSPHTLEILAKAITDNDWPGVVYGATDIVDKNGNYLGPRHIKEPEELEYNSFANGMSVCHQAFVALRRIVPLYNTRWRFSADYEWCIRVLQHSRLNVNVHTTIIDYLNDGMTTRNRRASLIERYKIMCRYYGTVPTTLRHLRFAMRFAWNAVRGRAK